MPFPLSSIDRSCVINETLFVAPISAEGRDPHKEPGRQLPSRARAGGSDAFSRVSSLRTRGIARREQKAVGGFGVGGTG